MLAGWPRLPALPRGETVFLFLAWSEKECPRRQEMAKIGSEGASERGETPTNTAVGLDDLAALANHSAHSLPPSIGAEAAARGPRAGPPELARDQPRDFPESLRQRLHSGLGAGFKAKGVGGACSHI